ncbi:MAG TPA: phosphate ABC transporter permease subunit PstC [Phycisphaerales bacterium]|nr:phosphate ABC transporter permease subunit PstC [Phycisphaerales bacterium]
MKKAAQSEAPAAEFARSLVLTPAQDWGGWLLGKAGRAGLLLITGTSVLAVLLIFVFIIREALPFFRARGLGEALGETEWYPTHQPAEFGMLAMLFGSLYVTAGALILAVPTGLLTAVVLSDIVPFRVRQTVKPIIEILAAIPSVAYGFFAVLVLAPWMQKNLGLSTGTNALNSSVMLAIMAIPTIVSVAEDSLWAAGSDLREASYACGATRAETLLKVVIPAAHSGVIAAIVLGMMRALGETMLVWMASGNATHIPTPWWDLTQSVRTMTATIAGELQETPVGSIHRHALFAVGLMLLSFSFLLNLLTEHLLRRSKRVAGGTKR